MGKPVLSHNVFEGPVFKNAYICLSQEFSFGYATVVYTRVYGKM